MNKLRLALAAQLLFFTGWAGWLLATRGAKTDEFYLETVPVDPRDLLAGTYVALTYDISSPGEGECLSYTKAGAKVSMFAYLYVKLEPGARTARTADGEVPLHEAVDCSEERPAEPGWAAAKLRPGARGNTVVYGVEKFYLNENDPRKDARSGEVVAKVKLDKRGRLVLLDLVKKI